MKLGKQKNKGLNFMILVLGLGMESRFGWLAVVLDLVP